MWVGAEPPPGGTVRIQKRLTLAGDPKAAWLFLTGRPPAWTARVNGVEVGRGARTAVPQ